MANKKRIRESLKTRDIRRAAKRIAELDNEAITKARKPLKEAVDAFHRSHDHNQIGTTRKYKGILGQLSTYCESESIVYLDQIRLERLDEYARGRIRPNWGGIKHVELLRQFFSFCIDREWMTRNPAKGLKRPKLLEAKENVPYTQEQINRIISACDFIGRASYERLRARAMVLLMRFAGLRISDVVTLSRDHINGTQLKKRAVKNGRWIQVELPAEVLQALEELPPAKAAAKESRRYFSGEEASLASLVKGAWRTLRAVFRVAKVEGAHPHRFRHTLASELLGKRVHISLVAAILADSEETIRKHYEKWTPEYQGLKDEAIRKIHGTHPAHKKKEAVKC